MVPTPARRPGANVVWLLVGTATFLLVGPGPARASVAVYVGKNRTADGSVLLAGYGDEPSSHWLEIVPRKDWPAGATFKAGATAAAYFPGELIEVPQVRRTAKYITMNYSEFAG